MELFSTEFTAIVLICSGITTPVVELIKKSFHWAGKLSVIISAVISVGISIPIGIEKGIEGIQLGILAIMTFAVANGFYKVINHKKKV